MDSAESSNSARRKRQKCSHDRISNLPESFIPSILSLLPTSLSSKARIMIIPRANKQIESGTDSARSLESSNLTCRKSQNSSPSHSSDLISNLPEPIISSILSLLPTKYAVSTSLLSKDWRFHWTDITNFDFDDLLFSYHGNAAELFVGFVDMVMTNSIGPINKFRMHCTTCISPDLLSKWFTAIVERNVRVLDFTSEAAYSSSSRLPDAIYSSGTLEVLKLGGPIQLIPPQVVCLSNLAVLELNKVVYKSDESITNLVSGCPVLQSLTIIREPKPQDSGNWEWIMSDNMVGCKISSPSLRRLQYRVEVAFYIGRPPPGVFLKLEIDAPALEYLKLHYNMSMKLCIKRPTSVKEVDLDVFHALNKQYSGDELVDELVRTFDRVESMKLGRNTLRALEGVPLSASFERLTKLVVQGIQSSSSLINLIVGCKKLEVIDICGLYYDRFDTEEEEYIIESGVPGCVVSSLKHVTIRSFDGPEMGMLHLFLRYGSVLERVNLLFNNYVSVSDKRKCDILNKLLKISRSSPTCQITWSLVNLYDPKSHEAET